jgi:hypothetical protein
MVMKMLFVVVSLGGCPFVGTRNLRIKVEGIVCV